MYWHINLEAFYCIFSLVKEYRRVTCRLLDSFLWRTGCLLCETNILSFVDRNQWPLLFSSFSCLAHNNPHGEQVKDVLVVHRFKCDDQLKWLPQEPELLLERPWILSAVRSESGKGKTFTVCRMPCLPLVSSSLESVLSASCHSCDHAINGNGYPYLGNGFCRLAFW